ncbi:MAG: thymidine phosphorylase [Rhodospirillales bacterium]|nr:thymidine phosphorylase [Rhodospirillales bacterium]
MSGFLPQEVIRAKRDGGDLDAAQIEAFVAGITDGSISEGQAAAFAMTVYLNGMDRDETVALTREMMNSGAVLDWLGKGLDGPILDKHSTGGVGDKVSLILGPLIAACGGSVPMISGRGLGHTGGTLDKLSSVPGYDTAPDIDALERVVRDAGCAIIGQTEDLAPADRRLYGIRDVTATVESIPLITASILSKKLAAGLTGLVMDVKTGTGAFASTFEMAHDLANSIVEVANGAGLATSALITDMNQVLGSAAGNAVEVMECVDYFKGVHRDPRLHEVTMALCAKLLVTGKIAATTEDAYARLEQALESGAAAERFGKMIAGLGGPNDFLERAADHLPTAPVMMPVQAEKSGYVTSMDTRAVGIAIVELGGGRRRADDKIDHAVGLTRVCQIGDEVGPERPLAVVHANSDHDLEIAAERLCAAIKIGENPPASNSIVIQRVGESAA